MLRSASSTPRSRASAAYSGLVPELEPQNTQSAFMVRLYLARADLPHYVNTPHVLQRFPEGDSAKERAKDRDPEHSTDASTAERESQRTIRAQDPLFSMPGTSSLPFPAR